VHKFDSAQILIICSSC